MSKIKLKHELVSLKLKSSEWTITCHKLSEIDPENNNLSKEEFEYFALFFLTEDIFQAESKNKQVLIDIGWYPDGEIDGEYTIVKLKFNSKNNMYDWNNPIEEFKTRSLKKLLAKIEELTK